jgi:hypothetical protein
MAVSNAELKRILTEQVRLADIRHEERQSELEGIKAQLIRQNGTIAQAVKEIAANKGRLDDLPCGDHHTDIAVLKQQMQLNPRDIAIARVRQREELSQTPREQGRTEATQEAHSVNWQRVVNIVSPIIVTLLLAALIAKP